MTPTMERVIFKPLPGTSDDDLLAAAEKTSDWLKAQPGFGYRTMIKEEDGRWADLVLWMDAENSQSANAAFGAAPENAEYLALIQMDSVQMTSHPQRLAAMAGG